MGDRGLPVGDALPPTVAQLLAATDQRAADAAWRAFIEAYSPLLVQVARSSASGHDSAMDAYTFLLDQLRENGCRRLRAYRSADGARFSTWLLVVARRLCIDFHRRRYGRPQGGPAASEATTSERATRRKLVDLAAEEIDVDSLSDERTGSPESEMRGEQLRQALARALDTLAPSDRLLLTMRFEDGRSAPAIARAMGFPTPFHVYRRLSAVLAQLRSALVAGGVDDPTP